MRRVNGGWMSSTACVGMCLSPLVIVGRVAAAQCVVEDADAKLAATSCCSRVGMDMRAQSDADG